MNKYGQSNILKISVMLMALGAVLVFLGSAKVSEGRDPDAVAVRMMSNEHHYNITDWYYSKGFTGAPQSIMVDGYQAIRDGRTVYVEIGNVDDDSNSLWHNIALISYTNNAKPTTQAIFEQLLNNWKFNTNTSDVGTCGISALLCATDADCDPSLECKPFNNNTSIMRCVTKENEDIDCRLDSDCPSGLFCNSQDAKIRRDIRRVGDINHIRKLLPQTSANWPQLLSGSYSTGKTMSVWPSWQDTLGSALGAVLPNDPINGITCPIAGSKTCWHEVVNADGTRTQKFGNLLPWQINKNSVSGFVYYYDKDSAHGVNPIWTETFNLSEGGYTLRPNSSDGDNVSEFIID